MGNYIITYWIIKDKVKLLVLLLVGTVEKFLF